MGDATGICWVEAKYAAKHPTVHRQVPTPNPTSSPAKNNNIKKKHPVASKLLIVSKPRNPILYHLLVILLTYMASTTNFCADITRIFNFK